MELHSLHSECTYLKHTRRPSPDAGTEGEGLMSAHWKGGCRKVFDLPISGSSYKTWKKSHEESWKVRLIHNLYNTTYLYNAALPVQAALKSFLGDIYYILHIVCIQEYHINRRVMRGCRCIITNALPVSIVPPNTQMIRQHNSTNQHYTMQYSIFFIYSYYCDMTIIYTLIYNVKHFELHSFAWKVLYK